MKAERFRQIRNLFDAALEREQEARNAFLREACQGDEELLMEVGKRDTRNPVCSGWMVACWRHFHIPGSLPFLIPMEGF